MASKSPRNLFSTVRTLPVLYPVFEDIEEVSLDQKRLTVMAKGVFPLMARDITKVDVPQPCVFSYVPGLFQLGHGGG